MDFNVYDAGFDENDFFESAYADELELVDGFQQPTDNEKIIPTEESTATDTLPDIQVNKKLSSKRKQLFSPGENEKDMESEELDFENDLVIDEKENFPIYQERKRPRIEPNEHRHKNLKKPSMPTTLDEDRDKEKERQEEIRRKKCLATPEMIEKIQRYKQSKYEAKQFLDEEADTESGSHRNIQLTNILIHPPIHSDFISATSSDGNRVYMRLRPQTQVTSTRDLMTTTRSTQLLPYTMAELRQKIYEKFQHDARAQSHHITQEVRSQSLQFSNSLTNQILADSSTSTVEDEGIYSGEESLDGLWVNKFAPTRYTHLLSDEGVNRSLLRWLKLWDKVVFGREFHPKKPAEEKHPKNEKYEKFNKFKKKETNELDEELDTSHRPKLKTALLCGPPGLGKTTLAHIIAKHAGYHVVEMNASDDRSAETFKQKLEQTTQMKSVLGSDQRPNCLIIDEIDGAPQAAINVLLNAFNKGKLTEKKKTNKKKSSGFLLRPIICICNDLYVPALRQLRQQSYILQFPPTTSAMLASRLSQMCRVQQMDCDLTSLLALCDKSGNDIRTCINTLQFVQSTGKNKLKLETIKSLDIGQKDQHKSIFYVWNEIFQLPKNQRKIDQDSQTVQQRMLEGQKVSQYSSRFYHILNIVSSCGEYEKTLQGVFDNFLLMKFKDSGILAINKAYEWLLLQDQINLHISSIQEWVLMRYTPYLFVFFHLLFACIAPPRIQFPQTEQENRKKLQKSENLLDSMFIDMAPPTRCFTTHVTSVLDLLPHLLAIMMPSFRPINMQLYSANEKLQLQDLVRSLLAYNLTFIQERNEDGQYNYVLEPNVAEVCHYLEPQEGAKKQLPYAIKQIISKEVETERMRRTERMMTKANTVETTKKAKVDDKTTKKPGIVPNHMQRLSHNISTTVTPDKPVVDFFSRFTKVKKVKQNEKENANHKVIVVTGHVLGHFASHLETPESGFEPCFPFKERTGDFQLFTETVNVGNVFK
uniref:chromosome transmission fidelity protein 18 homolog isoform X1 n=1 Tax=Ciona intestinalis TaxID=7719 RepID=UPI000EF4E142|nr:chromosome transmission fidelity protein 18 homolog isoform X1 [Ciona intestinalis]|eukprot:XP_026693827.1 chromosome transmission fidelity protein 18 homolog isoform X1 [Ciona intestinalis]